MEYLNAFLCGGVLCAVGQVLIDRTRLTPARILTGYVVAGVLLQAVGVYQPRPQLTAYSQALSRVLEAPVAERVLYFFGPGCQVTL